MATATLKCPACGTLRESFAAVCPECGYEFTDIQTSDALEKFTVRIDEYDRLIAEDDRYKSGGGVGFWTVVLWILFFPIMLILFIIKKAKAKHEELKGNEKLKSEAILNFPIPNSRNDLMEFIFMVENRVKPLTYFNALTQGGLDIQKWNNVWKTKAEHIQKKAQIALSGDSKSLNNINDSIAKINNQIAQNDKTQWIMMGGLLAIFLVWLIWWLL